MEEAPEWDQEAEVSHKMVDQAEEEEKEVERFSEVGAGMMVEEDLHQHTRRRKKEILVQRKNQIQIINILLFVNSHHVT